MENKLLILGAGQYGAVAMETAQAMKCYTDIAFLDDNNPNAIGKLSDFSSIVSGFSHAFVAMGNPEMREMWIKRICSERTIPAVLIHPQATVMPSAEIGGCSIIEAQAVVNSNTKLGYGNLICAGAIVNHNSILHPCCQIDCNAVVPSNSEVPPYTKILCGEVFKM